MQLIAMQTGRQIQIFLAIDFPLVMSVYCRRGKWNPYAFIQSLCVYCTAEAISEGMRYENEDRIGCHTKSNCFSKNRFQNAVSFDPVPCNWRLLLVKIDGAIGVVQQIVDIAPDECMAPDLLDLRGQ